MDGIYKDIVKQYTDEHIDNICNLTGGHINRSLLVTAGGGRYVLQCLYPDIFAGHLRDMESNYIQYRIACEQSIEEFGDKLGEWYCPEWILDQSGQFIHTDKEGRIWRMYGYIEGDRAAVGAKTDAYEIGVGLGKMHMILKKCDKNQIRAVFPHLHDLDYYYNEYLAVKDTVTDREPLLDKIISEHADEMCKTSLPAGEVIHGDAKINNMIFRNGKVVGFVDLDTLMCGSIFNDVSDCMRSSCLSDDLILINDRADLLLQGLEESTGIKITPDEKDLILDNLKRNCFMLGLRYYTDHLK
ncbi:MAG: phosphotransferase, partial [Lachnospiraceae bacterium]|nr:phosphotransferase [Lachnospiraceae bacterium]